MFLSAVLAEGSVATFLQHGSIDHLFRPTEIESYVFVKEFVKAHGALPKSETVEAHTKDDLTPHKEPSSYYLDLLVKRHTELVVKKAMKEANDNLSIENKNPDKALEVLTEAVMQLVTQRFSRKIIDFRQAAEMILSHYTQMFVAEEEVGLHMGWPTLDGMTGGILKGDVLSMVGRPATGKTWQLLSGLHHGWNAEGKKLAAMLGSAGADVQAKPVYQQSRLLISMEMMPLPINQRLISMHSHFPMSQFKQGLSTKSMKKLKAGLTEISGFGAPFWVVDGNLAATVEDVYLLARQLKPDAIGIDGGYLLKHPTERDRFRRVAENADLIKQNLAPIAPTVVSWQFAKTASKKKKDEKVGLEDIGYTDAIAQNSSVVLGMFEEESVETLVQRLIEIMKGRNGETGQFRTKWDFISMDFSEIVEESLEDLQFV